MDIKKKISDKLSDFKSEEKDQILENFNQFKKYLHEQIERGENIGLSDEQLVKSIEFVAGYLARNEDPRNREEHLLRELWVAGTDEEQKAFASMLLKMIKETA